MCHAAGDSNAFVFHSCLEILLVPAKPNIVTAVPNKCTIVAV